MRRVGLERSRTYIKKSRKSQEKIEKEKEEREKMWNFFLEIWNERPHYSEISGKWLGREPLSTFFHHVLPKSRKKELKYCEENIVLITPEEHDNIERGYKEYEYINNKKRRLIEKYGI